MAKMTEKQRRFADEYIRTGDITRSYMNAYQSVTNENSASAAGSRMLRNVKVRSFIDERLEELKKESIAEQDEILQYLTSVMRGKINDEQLTVVPDGDFSAGVERHEKRSDTNDRTKAAELLGKRYAIWTEKHQMDVQVMPVFKDSYGDEYD